MNRPTIGFAVLFLAEVAAFRGFNASESDRYMNYAASAESRYGCIFLFYLVRKPQKSPLTVSVGLIPLFWDSYDYDEQNHCHPQISAVGADARRYSSVHSTPRDL